MTLPLYNTWASCPTGHASLYYDENGKTNGHAGLYYDKFCDTWQTGHDGKSWNMQSDKEHHPKQEWLKEITQAPVGQLAELKEYAERQKNLWEHLGATPLFFRNRGRLVTGLGLNHAIENGFLWHPTLGVPYIPASSLKGVLRAWLKYWCVENKETATLLDYLGNDEKAGAILFFDALPVKPVKLEADVLTPHYAPYYQDSEHVPPADWHQPIPNPFLTVAPQTTFQTALISRAKKPVPIDDMQKLLNYFLEALKYLGMGAKTASGYGRMYQVKRKEQAT